MMDASPAQAAGPSGHASRWGILGLVLLVLASWALLFPYRGITHDGTLYGLLALSHLHPGSLDHDLFVRLGVQNDFTVFTPLYAGAARYLGLEQAAAVLTFLTHLSFYGCAWLLARRFTSTRTALLGVGLLIVLPAYYGWGLVFANSEAFLTPRQPAEVFGLAGLIAILDRRHVLAVALMLVALLLHPIVATGAIALGLVLHPNLRRPYLAVALLGVTCLVIVLSATLNIWPFAHFDPHWLGILQTRLKYLFPTRWPAADWGPLLVPLAALFVGFLTVENEAMRRLLLATAAVVVFAVGIAVIESDWLHVIVAGQVQVWRWQWLSSTLGPVFLPLIAVDCWRGSALARSAVVLIIAAWLDAASTFALLTLLGGCGLAIGARAGWGGRLVQFIFVGCLLLLAASLANVLVEIYDSIRQMQTLQGGTAYGRFIEGAHLLAYHGVLPGLVLAAAWGLAASGPRAAALVTVLGLLACAAMSANAFERWTRIVYTPQRLAAYAPWRAAIPPATTVLWPEDPPMDAWFALQRPAYWSLYQMAGMVFSREDAMIGTWLESQADPILPSIRSAADNAGLPREPEHTKEQICRLPGIAFFASWNDLGPTPFPPVAPDGKAKGLLYLYHCAPATQGNETPAP